MKYVVYAVKDELVSFMDPIYVQDNGRADMLTMRSFKEAIRNKQFGDATVDCNLYKIGTFDNTTGTHENYKFPEVLLTAKEILAENEVSEDV